tara:strand:+ start:1244 stop:1666 length:423 start_codon:yes stop_codon:yes gene_type:complete
MNDQKQSTSMKNIIKAIEQKFKFIEEDIVKNRYLLLQLIKNINKINKTLDDVVFDDMDDMTNLNTSDKDLPESLASDVIDELQDEFVNNNYINDIIINNRKFDVVDALLFLNGQEEDLKEFERLLEKYKDCFTPTIVGNS